jgi:hypothetical protein
MPGGLLELTNRIMRSPVRISLQKEDFPLEGIRQFYACMSKKVKQLQNERNILLRI